MTVDEELSLLESHLRRLKIEYEVFFNNPQKKAPSDLEWKVLTLLRKFSDGSRMSFSQRYRFNELAQPYAIYSDLWRKKSRIREEGYRRPQDALLSIQGIRTEQTHEETKKHTKTATEWEPLKVKITDPTAQRDTVRTLFDALSTARLHAKEGGGPATFDSFANFVQKKTNELRGKYHCKEVEYEVEMKEGKVKLVARPK